MSRTLFALLLVPLLATAQIYKTTDEDGNVLFTDSPGGATTEKIELPSTNTTAPPPAGVIPPPEPAPSEEEARQYEVTITSPDNETTIPMGPGNFSVSAAVTPRLIEGAQLQLLMDGEAQGEPQASGNWDLTNVFRGAHDLTVAVVDGSGERVAQSDPVRVYVLRPSVNFKNRN
tara:strand:- start:324558 stop:325079 length:522 start_codon:yes stop_codon:yes gene_type:complete